MKHWALLAAVLAVASPVSAGERFSVVDEGEFGPTGRHVEFPDRYGWRSYKIKMDFSLDDSGRRLTKDSTMQVTIVRKEGGTWEYKCRAQDPKEMWALVNLLWGKGLNVLTQCRIDPEDFAKSIGLDAESVGEPTLVFAVRVKDGRAQPGLQKGMYFLAGAQIEASEMNQYATQNDDPSDLAVLFATDDTVAQHPATQHPGYYYYQPVPRFVP